MRDAIAEMLYEAMSEMLRKDPHGANVTQRARKYWEGKLDAYADVIQLMESKEES